MGSSTHKGHKGLKHFARTKMTDTEIARGVSPFMSKWWTTNKERIAKRVAAQQAAAHQRALDRKAAKSGN